MKIKVRAFIRKIQENAKKTFDTYNSLIDKDKQLSKYQTNFYTKFNRLIDFTYQEAEYSLAKSRGNAGYYSLKITKWATAIFMTGWFYIWGLGIFTQLTLDIFTDVAKGIAQGYYSSSSSHVDNSLFVLTATVLNLLIAFGVTTYIYSAIKAIYKQIYFHSKWFQKPIGKIIAYMLIIILFTIMGSIIISVFAKMTWFHAIKGIMAPLLLLWMLLPLVSFSFFVAFPNFARKLLSILGDWRVTETEDQEIIVSLSNFIRQDFSLDEIAVCEECLEARYKRNSQAGTNIEISIALLGIVAGIIAIVFGENLFAIGGDGEGIARNALIIIILLVGIMWFWYSISFRRLQDEKFRILSLLDEACCVKR